MLITKDFRLSRFSANVDRDFVFMLEAVKISETSVMPFMSIPRNRISTNVILCYYSSGKIFPAHLFSCKQKN